MKILVRIIIFFALFQGLFSQSKESSQEEFKRKVLIGEYYSLLRMYKTKEALEFAEQYFPKHLVNRIKRDGHKPLSKNDFDESIALPVAMKKNSLEPEVKNLAGSSHEQQANMVKAAITEYNKLLYQGQTDRAMSFAKKYFPPSMIKHIEQHGHSPISGFQVKEKKEEVVEKPELTYSKVKKVHVRETDELYNLTYEDNTLIQTTWSHPFYIIGKGWVEAKDLKVGDRSKTASGKGLLITKIEIQKLGKPVKVYNLELEGEHNFFVSNSNVLVHNTNYDSPSNEVKMLDRNPLAKKDNLNDVLSDLSKKTGESKEKILAKLQDAMGFKSKEDLENALKAGITKPNGMDEHILATTLYTKRIEDQKFSKEAIASFQRTGERTLTPDEKNLLKTTLGDKLNPDLIKITLSNHATISETKGNTLHLSQDAINEHGQIKNVDTLVHEGAHVYINQNPEYKTNWSDGKSNIAAWTDETKKFFGYQGQPERYNWNRQSADLKYYSSNKGAFKNLGDEAQAQLIENSYTATNGYGTSALQQNPNSNTKFQAGMYRDDYRRFSNYVEDWRK